MIECLDLWKQYGSSPAVKGINLTVKSGQVFGCLGPNGAGKTTTIQMLVGLLRPTSGTARIGGYDVVRQPVQAKALIGYVPDEPYLYEKLTAREFLDFTCRLYGVPPHLRKQRMDGLVERFGLQNDQHQLVGSYSHGMRQKVALAAALVHQPAYLFLDEPTVGLDPRTARLLKDLLGELAADGTTVFFSTHILDIAQAICHHVAIIDHGQIVAAGSMDELQALSRGSMTSLEDIFLELTQAHQQETTGLRRVS